MKIQIQNQTLELSPHRAIFWQEERALILSDLHIGKGGHFRKAGIPVPGQLQADDLVRLARLVEEFLPEKLIVVGDMFHSRANGELDVFAAWRSSFPALRVILVQGNHDILHRNFYEKCHIELVQDGFELGGFRFVHAPPAGEGSRFVFSGHLHPGVLIRGQGRQRFRLPCYWFSAGCVVLPAFGKFTGLHLVQPRPGERVVAIAEGELLDLG